MKVCVFPEPMIPVMYTHLIYWRQYMEQKQIRWNPEVQDWINANLKHPVHLNLPYEEGKPAILFETGEDEALFRLFWL